MVVGDPLGGGEKSSLPIFLYYYLIKRATMNKELEDAFEAIRKNCNGVFIYTHMEDEKYIIRTTYDNISLLEIAVIIIEHVAKNEVIKQEVLSTIKGSIN